MLKTGVVGVVPKVSGAVVCAADGKADSNRLRAVATSPENQRCGLAAARKECGQIVAKAVSIWQRVDIVIIAGWAVVPALMAAVAPAVVTIILAAAITPPVALSAMAALGAGSLRLGAFVVA